ncbi:hypothetical protein CSAL01_10837 [Colletotrichum salicis]|uniref:Uncharacterized protein n=1 Tax=Colletotrichum salicis TaxID=1209931 RepID=A0A135UXX8_9PEZI|nr:hypothetical protein CSAL01_10837 [Colletotrichum salicis]
MIAVNTEERLHTTATEDEPFTMTRADEKYAPDQSIKLEAIGEEALAIDPIVEKRVLRKIDLFRMPAWVIGQYAGMGRFDQGYGLVYYDKVGS